MSTSSSVPDVQSTGATAGALSEFPTSPAIELIRAAEALALRWITRDRGGPNIEPTECCMVCMRSSLRRPTIDHAAGCQVGAVLRAIAVMRREGVQLRVCSCTVETGIGASWCALHGEGSRLPEPARGAELSRTAAVCGAESEYIPEARCTLAAGHDGDHRDQMYTSFCHAREAARKDWGAAQADQMDRLSVPAKERRVVCGAHWIAAAPGHPVTCDRKIGHDADPLSDHWNREARMSWPTAARIAAEAQDRSQRGRNVDVHA